MLNHVVGQYDIKKIIFERKVFVGYLYKGNAIVGINPNVLHVHRKHFVVGIKVLAYVPVTTAYIQDLITSYRCN